MSINAAQIDENGLVENVIVVEEQDFLPEYKPADLNIVRIPYAVSDDGNLVVYMPVKIGETKYINDQFVDQNNEPLTIDQSQIIVYNKRLVAWQTPPEVY